MYLKLTIVSFFVLSQQFEGVFGSGICPAIPPDICPYGISEHTGKSVKLTPKYLTRDHPEYDVRTPEEARDKLNLYCAHPACYSHPCLNGATCFEELDGYTCFCLEGYNGIHCEHVKCPDASWTTFQGSCYKYFDNKINFHQALSTCRSLTNEQSCHADLVSIHGVEEQEFIGSLCLEQSPCNGEKHWIGLYQPDPNGPFVWSDGTPVDYTAWRSNEPNNGNNNEDCANSDFPTVSWNDLDCYREIFFICKLPAVCHHE